MTPEKQRIAIAEACGWSETPSGKWHRNGFVMPDPLNPPDYLWNLNAMHEAEKTLSYNDKQKYLDILADAPREDIYYTWADSVFATAAQRAEAFLKAIGKYES